MDRLLKDELGRVRDAAQQARALVEAARQAGGCAEEAARRARELSRLEDLGRSAVLECLEEGEPALALEAASRLAEAVADEAERAARSLALARLGRAEAP